MVMDEVRHELQPLEVRHGLKGLAEFIGKSERQTHYLVTTGIIPAVQLGGRWSWSPTKVRAVVLGEAGAGK